MAAETLSRESFKDETAENSPLEQDGAPSSSSISEESRLDWTSTLSPIKRSCIRMTNIEPCLNKAMDNLEALKQSLSLKESYQHRASMVVTSANKRSRATSMGITINTAEEHDPELSVEGVQTGTVVTRLPLTKKAEIFQAGAVVASVLNLMAKLEHGRQEFQSALAEQEATAQNLREELDREEERRLDLLLTCVQAEHDRSANHIRQLKWHINFEGRKLRRQLESQKRLTKRNNELKQEVKHLTELNPQIEEKIEFEQVKIKGISRMQQETLDDLNATKQDHLELKEKCRQIHLIAESEKQLTAEKKGTLSLTLNAENAELKNVKAKSTAISHKISESNSKLHSLHKKTNNLEIEIGVSVTKSEVIQSRMDKLEVKRESSDWEANELQKRVRELTRNNQDGRKNLVAGYFSMSQAMDREEKAMVKAKREKEDLECDIEIIKENIVKTRWKIADNEKSVTRAHREMARLDQQLEVSLLEYNHAYRSHRRAAEEYKLEKVKSEREQDNLQDKVENLKKKLREEHKVQILFENKTKAQDATLMKLMVEHEKQEERVLNIVEEQEEHVREKTEKVQELQEIHDETVKQLETTQTELRKVTGELATLEIELGEKKTELTSLEKQLKVEMVEKVEAVETTTEKIKDLEGKLEDKVKSITMLKKLQNSTLLAIEKFQLELTGLEEKLAIEREKVESWRDEYKEIADFSGDTDSKHAQYLKDRNALLNQQKLDLEKSMCDNTELAVRYHHLQCQFITVKTRALRVIERKLKLETSLRDHQQEHLGSREVKFKNELRECHRESQQNMHDLHSVRGQLETVLTLLLAFLEQQRQHAES